MTKASASSATRPCLAFHGQCEEAIEFYRRALGAEVGMMLRFKDCPEQPVSYLPLGWEAKIMHATILIGDSTILFSDEPSGEDIAFQGFALSHTVKTVAAARRVFKALAKGGHVQMPLTKTFFSPSFGLVTDRFGVRWKVHVTSPVP